ncbi:MAG: ribokinase [bacterium]
MALKVLALGAMNMDLVTRAGRMPKVGESMPVPDFVFVPGGKGSNHAIAISKMGGEVYFVGRVGRDPFGDRLIQSLRESGVNTDYVRRDPERHSGIAVVVLGESGQNSIIVAHGANDGWGEEEKEVIGRLLRDVGWLIAPFEPPFPILRYALSEAKRRGVRTILDAGPAKRCPEEIISLADIISPNESEAELLTGIAVTDLNSAARAGKRFLDMGCEAAVVKLGERGSLIVDKTGAKHVEAMKVPVVDTTAAGDAFTGVMAYCLAEGMDLREAVRYGTCAGALAVTKFGSQPSIPDGEAVRRLAQTGRYEEGR